MTASEISRIIAAKDGRFGLNWRAVSLILGRLDCAPTVTLSKAQDTFQTDSEAEPVMFGDLDYRGCITKIALIAQEFGCPGDFAKWLSDILLDDQHPPYWLLLHYQLLVQAHFDHAVTYAYEFNPRGRLADWLTEKYIDAQIHVAKNAFLNNAKAILRFDKGWATGRIDHLRSATALAGMLEQIECLGLSAKSEISALIRALLHRKLRVSAEDANGALPMEIAILQRQDISNLLDSVAEGNSETTGIIEQRIVDCLALSRHEAPPLWSSRGVGDSVFAPSTFCKKLGDCEFERADRQEPTIIGYEAHAGRLSVAYFEDHMDSFRTVLAVRRDDLESIANISEWNLKVVLVAHEFEEGIPREHRLLMNDGSRIDVSVTTMTFLDVANELKRYAGIENLFERHLRHSLNNPFVHPGVRERARRLAAP